MESWSVQNSSIMDSFESGEGKFENGSNVSNRIIYVMIDF